MTHLPYPPAPEFGWYDDDVTVNAEQGTDAPQQTATDQEVSPQEQATGADQAQQVADQPATKVNIADMEEDVEDWDGTMLSESFTLKTPKVCYKLHNDATGQDIVVDKSLLLGRKPSAVVPVGAKSERIEDPTRTVSRNHAAISFAEDGKLWIEDYGSLNGSYIIRGDEETPVSRERPLELEVPATIRLGDQFFEFTQV